jgi:hypothetical protein
MRARRNVEKDHLIGALIIVANGEFHRVADIAQAPFFRATELDAAGDFTIVNVEAGYDAFCQH